MSSHNDISAIERLGFGKFQIKLSLLTGLAWMSDAMEMMILSILSPALHCSWGLLAWQRASITTAVFVGMMMSSMFWGKICDRFGRRTALLMSALFTFYFGFLSSFSPTFIWLIILRGLTGFGIGGAPQSVTLYAEFLPSKYRAKCLILIEIFWGIGTCFEVLLALFVMPTLGWPYLLAFSSLPLLVFALFCIWLPESARYHVACKNFKAATLIIERIAKENGVPMPIGTLVGDEEMAASSADDPDSTPMSEHPQQQPPNPLNTNRNASEGYGTTTPPTGDTIESSPFRARHTSSALLPTGEQKRPDYPVISAPFDVPSDTLDLLDTNKRGQIKDLFAPDVRRTTYLLWIIWMVNAFSYYGIVLMTTELFESGGECHGGGQRVAQPTCLFECHPLQRSDYIDLLWTTLAEFPGLFLTVFIIESIGRKWTMALEFFAFSIFIFLLNICSTRSLMTTFIFIARTVISAGFQATYVYTPEVYPTTIRALGMGTCSMMARIGAILTPFVAQVMLKSSVNGAIDLYAMAGIIAGICALLLPIETKGREMRDTITNR